MKIAHVCPFYEPTICGVKQTVKELATRQVAEGHEVHVFTSDWDKNERIKKKYEIIDGVHVHRCFYLFRLSKFSTFFPTVFFKILSKKFDIVHTHNSGHMHIFLATLASKIRRTPTVHTTHCPWGTESSRSFKEKILIFISYNILNKIALKLSDKIIAITPWEIDFIKKYTKESKIVVIPNGVDSNFFKKIKPNKFKEKYNIEEKLVLFFGRFNVTKGPDKFVLAAKEILKEDKKISFAMVGPDEGMKSKVIDLANNNKRIKIIDPLKTRKEVIEMYQAADVYVLPSLREGLPLTLFEAMASGLPIIASPVNGIPYEMKDPENGYFVKYGDVNNLKKAILRVIKNPKISKFMSENNIKKAKEYNWDKISKKTIEVYKSI